MTYTLIWDLKAYKLLLALERDIAIRVDAKVNSILEDPYHFCERIKGRKTWKLRVGDHLVFLKIVDVEKKVRVTFVGHRKNVYDNEIE